MYIIIRYILISTCSLSLLYLAFLLFQRVEHRFGYKRFFLIASVVISLVLPFSSYRLSLDTRITQVTPHIPHVAESQSVMVSNSNTIHSEVPEMVVEPTVSLTSILLFIYVIGISIMSLRIGLHLFRVFILYRKCDKYRQNGIVHLTSPAVKSPFTFFKWIFLPSELHEARDVILAHERIHARQYHSLDILLVELVAAIMWFNPLVWKMKKSIQLIHEYLADEGVLRSGANPQLYQALLLNQVTEGNLICLASNFNHSLIKKRITMMSKRTPTFSKKHSLLLLLPLTAILFIGTSFINGGAPTTKPDAFTVLIDAGHGGHDSGCSQGAVTEKDLNLAIIEQLKEKVKSKRNINLIFTRESDVFLPLDLRTTKDADLFISIHFNYHSGAMGFPIKSGIECYAPSASAYKAESDKIGAVLLEKFGELDGIVTIPTVKHAGFKVLKDSKCPAVLLELGFLSNPNDLAYVTNEYNQGLLCDKIIEAIDELN